MTQNTKLSGTCRCILHLRLIHTLTWLNFDYHWLCVWFGSCENRRLTQSRSSGVLHGWPGVQNASACRAPQGAERLSRALQINSVELNWVKRRTSHEPSWLSWVRLMWSTAFDEGLTCLFSWCGKTKCYISEPWSQVFRSWTMPETPYTTLSFERLCTTTRFKNKSNSLMAHWIKGTEFFQSILLLSSKIPY